MLYKVCLRPEGSPYRGRRPIELFMAALYVALMLRRSARPH